MSSEDPNLKNEAAPKTTYVYLREDHQVVTHRARIFLIILISLLLLALLWAFFGSIPITIEGKGIVVNERGLLYNIVAKEDSIVRKVNVKTGDFVTQGQVLIETFDPTEEIRYKNSLAVEAKAKTDLETAKKLSDSQTLLNTKTLKTQVDQQKDIIQQANADIEKAQKDLPIKQQMLARGLIKADELKALNTTITGNQTKIVNANAALSKLEQQLALPFSNKDLEAKELALKQATIDRQTIEFYHALYKVIAPNQGNILEVMVDPGEKLKSGDPIVWMEYSDKENSGKFIIKAFFPVEKGKSLTPGMNVDVEMSTVDAKEFGYLQGTVQDVSQFAVSREKISKIIHNEDLIKHLTEGFSATIEATILPVVDPESGAYVWTSGRTPEQTITTGTVCTVRATVATIRPIYYVLPLGKFKVTTPTPTNNK